MMEHDDTPSDDTSQCWNCDQPAEQLIEGHSPRYGTVRQKACPDCQPEGTFVVRDLDAGDEQLVTDGGTVEHPGLEAVAAEEYTGTVECDYGCGSTAEYRVEMRLGGASDLALMCNDCSQQNKVWVEENELLKGEISEEAWE